MSDERGEDGIFPVLLSLLKDECGNDGGATNYDSSSYQAAVATMLRLLRNINQNPSEEKFRRVRLGNKSFAGKVWKFEGAQQFLLAAGWVVLDDCIVLTDDSSVQSALDELEKEQRRVQPAGSGPPTQTPSSSVPTENKDKEISEGRKRQLEAMKREKEERKRISEQIQADRQEIRARPVRGDSRVQERRFGGTKRFEDIGIDLNRGGG